jgi:Na+/proline symporter
VTGGILGAAGLAVMLAYLASLLLIGWWANRASREESARDYYLAGSSLGMVSLFFTLYATQYSGNTLLAAPGKAYRTGFDGLAIVLAVMGVVLVYSSFAPALNRLARRHEFITVADFVRWRYRSNSLLIAVNTVLVATLVTYALGNFKAIGLLLESVSGGAISFPAGILLMALIMGMYESMGGMRGVVWTDVLQGLMLLVGCLVIYFAVVAVSPEDSIVRGPALFAALGSYFREDVQPASFISLVFLIAVGAAVYPQAVQRIYAARDEAVLRRSYRMMFFIPLVTTLPMLLVGMSVAEWQPGLSLADSEQVVIIAIQHVAGILPGLGWLLILCLAAALAAIMSTIDSALLSLGSILTRDMPGNRLRAADSAASLRKSRVVSWLLMMLMALLAILLPQSMWALMVFKFELLIQLAPALILGVRLPALGAGAVFAGLAAGAVVVIGMEALPGANPLAVHSGIWGLGANLLVLWLYPGSRKVA